MKNKQDKWEKFITSPRWKWKRQNILRRDSYTDQWILQHEGRHVQADMVHHILPKEDFPQYAMADWNLIAVSRRTHNKVLHNMNGDLTRKGKALMLETAEKNGILLMPSTASFKSLVNTISSGSFTPGSLSLCSRSLFSISISSLSLNFLFYVFFHQSTYQNNNHVLNNYYIDQATVLLEKITILYFLQLLNYQ